MRQRISLTKHREWNDYVDIWVRHAGPSACYREIEHGYHLFVVWACYRSKFRSIWYLIRLNVWNNFWRLTRTSCCEKSCGVVRRNLWNYGDRAQHSSVSAIKCKLRNNSDHHSHCQSLRSQSIHEHIKVDAVCSLPGVRSKDRLQCNGRFGLDHEWKLQIRYLNSSEQQHNFQLANSDGYLAELRGRQPRS